MGNALSIRSYRWNLPNIREVKLCCDGSALGNPRPSRIGVVYRDWEGRVLGTFSKAVGSATNYLAEVQAIVYGVEKHYIEAGILNGLCRTPRQPSKHLLPVRFPGSSEASGGTYSYPYNQSTSTQLGEKQISRWTPRLRKAQELTYLLRNGLRVDQNF
ncbi:hypothetical protein GIB67_036814 [Kingdonia uniflora]|uniref:RNase H type-1 domain-containing protein n=1 Tax=Kingdonia uniflora TaxID=39325 RepID=A0A7J7LWW8_9MAGN|nr:hypothetical protein GIB67_036814 [Kingdonia uniflora]